MHLPRNTGPVSYYVSQNNTGASITLAFVVLQHAPCPTRKYRRHKAGVPVMARLQREYLPPLSAAACLALPSPIPTRRLSSVGARQMSGVTFSCLAATKLRMHSSILKPVPPFQRTNPVDNSRPAIFKRPFSSRTQRVFSIPVDGRT